MGTDTYQIRIDFPVPVEVSREAHRVIVHGVDMICTAWERANPGQVMWSSGFGALMLTNPLATDDLKFDESVEHIEVSCREGYPKELRRREKKQFEEHSAHEQLCLLLYETFGRSFDAKDAPVWSRVASEFLGHARALAAAPEQEDLIKHMVDRFLSWRLPEDFSPDDGISFEPEFNKEWMAQQGKPPMRHEPTGTNLFTATQAEAMVRHMLSPSPEAQDGGEDGRA